MPHNERELILSRSREVVQRLKDLGISVPPPPDTEGNQFTPCQACNGVGHIAARSYTNQYGMFIQEKTHCPKCLGSGQLVENGLLEWNKNLVRLVEKIKTNG